MPDAERQYAYDVVRTVAMVFVVCVHSLVVIDQSSTVLFLVFAAGQALFFTANGLFFMLSGRFNLRERETPADLARYYLRRFRGFILPVLIVFLIRTLYDLYPTYESALQVAKAYAVNVLGGLSGVEYWFVYALFGFLLVAPFLAPAFSHMSPFAKRVFFGIGLGYNLLVLIADNRGVEFAWGYLFSGFAFAFCLGAFVEDLFATKRSRRVLYAAAAFGLVATVVMAWEGLYAGIHDTSPFYTLLAIGIYIFILNAAKGARPSRVVSFMAKHSFSVYLIHTMFLRAVCEVVPAVSGGASLLAYPVVVAATLALSLAGAVLIDTVLVRPAQRLFDRLTARLPH